MKPAKKVSTSGAARKSATGIEGFDEITHGGLARGRTTLVMGGPGSGKTVFALQTLVNGARRSSEPGIFVAFEENSRRIIANAASFGWDLAALEKKNLFFLDAQPRIDATHAGQFDLQGLLAALEVKIRKMGAKRIVFDAIDVVLSLLNDPIVERRELSRLHEWLQKQELTAIITAKVYSAPSPQALSYDAVQFMVDCSVMLNHTLVSGVSQRSLCVSKYRGSSFSENESPLVISETGIEVAGPTTRTGTERATTERVLSGIPRLDTMLGGGYFRNSSILTTGSPGTAKTTLAGAFAHAACKRGERVLFVSYDSDSGEVLRNLASIGIDLESDVRRGRLKMVALRKTTASAEVQLMHMKALIKEFQPRSLVVDPISALSKPGNEEVASSVVERLIDWTKSRGITTFFTSLLADNGPDSESTPIQVSTIADTWIHLSYLGHAGERNRALTIVKSRGTSHSNQIREMILSSEGVTLTDVYTSGGQVLMGALRWEKEQAETAALEAEEAARIRRRRELETSREDLTRRISALQHEMEELTSDLSILKERDVRLRAARISGTEEARRIRGGDDAPAKRSAGRKSSRRDP